MVRFNYPFSAIGNHSNKGFKFYPAIHCRKPEHLNESFQYQPVKKELWTGLSGQGLLIETSISNKRFYYFFCNIHNSLGHFIHFSIF